MWLAALLSLCVNQADEALPRVLRENGKICIEAPDDRGEVKVTCRAETVPWSSTRTAAPASPTGARGVASVTLGLGLLTAVGVTLPEMAFAVDAGVVFPNAVGVVALMHAHASPLIGEDLTMLQRYGLGAALRLGTRSHFLLGLTGTMKMVQGARLHASPTVSLVMKGALVISDSTALVLMPVFGFDQGVAFSLSIGIGATL